MNQNFTYHEDTTRINKSLSGDTIISPSSTLNIELKAPLKFPLDTLRMHVQSEKADSFHSHSHSVVTPYQIRFRRWQREKNLTIGNSRYLSNIDTVKVTTTSSISEPIHLPMNSVSSTNHNWLTAIFLVMLIIIASVRTTWSKYIKHLFHSIINYSTSDRMFNEKNISIKHGAFWLDLHFHLVFSVFLFQLFNYFKVDISFFNFHRYLFCLGLSFSFFSIKKIVYRLLGVIFETSYETGEYIFNLSNYTRICGIILLPLTMITTFYPFQTPMVPLSISIFFCLVLYFLLLFRGFLILIKKQFSIFYLFLYFCTLEILPLVLLYKILVI